MSTDQPLEGARILVAGASSGIGAALVSSLLAREARVVAAARRLDRLEEVVADAADGHAVAADVTDPAPCDQLVQATVEHLGGLDAMVYAAGVGTLAPISGTDPDAWRRDHEVNVIGSNLLTARILPHLADSGIAAYIASRGVVDHHWGLASYYSSKAALDQTIHAWRIEHPDKRFLRVQMGNTIGTEFGDHLDPDLMGQIMETWPGQGIDLGFMEVDDVAEALADVLATALAHPALDIREYQLDGRPL